jgi:hypothetical protein
VGKFLNEGASACFPFSRRRIILGAGGGSQGGLLSGDINQL